MSIIIKVKSLLNVKFITDAVFTIASHFLVGISGLLINTIIGNKFDADGLGVLNQGLSVYILLALVSNFGIQTSAQKHSSQYIKDKEKIKLIFTNAVLSTFMTSVAVILCFLIIIEIFPSIIKSVKLLEIVMVFIFGAPLFALNKTINNFMTGLREMKIYSFVRVIRWLIIIISLLLLVQIMALPLITAAYAFIVSEVCILIYFLVKTRAHWGGICKTWIFNHLSFGLKSILADFVSTFNTRIPILLVGSFLGDAAAGYYSYIEVFAYSILMISGALQKNFNPVFTILWHDNNFNEINLKIKKVFRILIYLLLPMLSGIYVLYYGYTTIFMEESYLDYSNVLIALMFGVSIRFLFGPFFTFLIMADYLNANLLRVLVNALVNIILILVLLKPMGLIGVPVAFGASMLIDLTLLNYLYKRNLKLHLFRIIGVY